MAIHRLFLLLELSQFCISLQIARDRDSDKPVERMMMDLEERSVEQLVHQLLHLCEGSSSAREEESLLRSCLTLVANYLHILERHGRRVRKTKRDVEYDLPASDCLAVLFQRDASGRYPQLQGYFLALFQAY